MRILSLGYPLPGVPLDNYSFASAPSFFDYDALIVDPQALSRLIEEVATGSREHRERDGEVVVRGAAGAGESALSDLLRRRRDEAERLLARGGLIVCFAAPNVAHTDVAEGCDRYCWLPAPPGLRYDTPLLRQASGTQIAPVDADHPFAPLLIEWRGRLAYHAAFSEDAGAAIARSAGGEPVAVELRVGDGHVIFLPPPERPPTGDQRYAFSQALQTAVRATLRRPSHSAPPAWLRDHALPDVPETQGLDRLLWQEGRYGLEEPVRAALTLLGFRVAPDDIDAPAQIQLGRGSALIEVAGATGAVGLEAHYPLRRRLEEAIALGKPKHGVLIINGYRLQDPATRPQQHDERLRLAAETMRYGVATSAQLHRAARAAIAGDDEAAQRFRDALLTAEGIVGDG